MLCQTFMLQHSVCCVLNGLDESRLSIRKLVRRLAMTAAWSGMEAVEVCSQDFKKGESTRDGG